MGKNVRTILSITGFVIGFLLFAQYSLVWALKGMIIGFSIGTAVSPMPKADKPSAKYEISEVTNTNSNESVVPLIYGGPVIYGGNIIYDKEDEAAGTRERLIGVCVGEVDKIYNIQANEQDLGDLDGCSVTIYRGTEDQTIDARPGGDVESDLKGLAYLALTLAPSDKLRGNVVVSSHIIGKKIKKY